MRLILMLILYWFAAVVVLAENTFENKSDEFLDAMSAAQWHEALSNARGGDQTELRFALSALEKAKNALKNEGATPAELEPLEIARQSITSQLEIQQQLLMGFSPLFPMLLGQDELLV